MQAKKINLCLPKHHLSGLGVYHMCYLLYVQKQKGNIADDAADLLKEYIILLRDVHSAECVEIL